MIIVEEKQIDIVDNVKRQDFQCVICGEKLRGGNLQLHMNQHKEYYSCLKTGSIPVIDNKGNEQTEKTYTPPNTIVDDWITNGDNL
jgi:hypothetical protein